MSIARLRGRGQLTIPSELRKQLHLEDEATLQLMVIGDALVMTPYQAQGEKLARKFERDMKRRSITFDDVLKDLRAQRKDISRERHGL